MGQSTSKISNIVKIWKPWAAYGEDLNKFIGQEAIGPEDPFWTEFLNFRVKDFPTTAEDKIMYEEIKPFFVNLAKNNLKTGNFCTLLRLFLSRTSEILVSAHLEKISFGSEAYNALYMIRFYIQYLAQSQVESEILKQIEVNVSNKPEISESMTVQLIDSLVDIIVHVPVKDVTYMLHCEVINALLVLLSVQLFTTLPTAELEIFKTVYDNKQSEVFFKTLTNRFVIQEKVPVDNSGSVLLGIAADFLGLFVTPPERDSPLGRKAALLCSVLVNHCIGNVNPYRDCMATMSDGLEGLFNTVCANLHREETTLLLYHLLHRNNHFRAYVLARADIETLVLPMLNIIYDAQKNSCHHIYMSLIVLLILSEDSGFNKRVHSIILNNVVWYNERSLTALSLGGLVVLVTARTVQYNLLKMRDEYLHSNCLAALANMSSQFTNLHPYVCQRLVSLFEILSKTYYRAKQELVVIERALRIILEVINSCLSNQLMHNPNLVYTLLYKRSIFDNFRGNPAFQDIINNLDEVFEYFTKQIEKDAPDQGEVNVVLEAVRKAALQWPVHRLQKFPELKFKYIEEEKPEEFFIPYVWTLITQYSNIYWKPSLFKQC